MKTMKKISLMIAALLIFTAGLAGCHNHEDEEDTKMVYFWGNQVPYKPVAIENMPEWLQDIVLKGSAFTIFMGTLNSQPVYNFALSWSSSLAGGNYDKDGNYINVSVNDVTNWVCIYNTF